MHGTRVGWIVVPGSHEVRMLYPDRRCTVRAGTNRVDGADILSGFRLRVERIFE